MRYFIGKIKEEELWEIEFEESLKRTVEERLDRGFIKTYKPVIDDAPYRIFSSMIEYRKWCEENLPYFLGYNKNEV
jgi:hypothetical protein